MLTAWRLDITIVGDRLGDVHQRFLVVPRRMYIHRVAVGEIPQMKGGGGVILMKIIP
jgi:hypothetical protein